MAASSSSLAVSEDSIFAPDVPCPRPPPSALPLRLPEDIPQEPLYLQSRQFIIPFDDLPRDCRPHLLAAYFEKLKREPANAPTLKPWASIWQFQEAEWIISTSMMATTPEKREDKLYEAWCLFKSRQKYWETLYEKSPEDLDKESDAIFELSVWYHDLKKKTGLLQSEADFEKQFAFAEPLNILWFEKGSAAALIEELDNYNPKWWNRFPENGPKWGEDFIVPPWHMDHWKYYINWCIVNYPASCSGDLQSAIKKCASMLTNLKELGRERPNSRTIRDAVEGFILLINKLELIHLIITHTEPMRNGTTPDKIRQILGLPVFSVPNTEKK